jgi:hypothetical protein
MSQLIIPGSLQYKTSLAWGSGGDALVESFTLHDKEIAIVKVSHIYTITGGSYRRLLSTPPWVQVGGIWVSGAERTSPYYAPTNTQSGVRILRVGTTLYNITPSTFTALGVGHVLNSHSPGFNNRTYTYTLGLATDTVSGTVGTLGSPEWNATPVDSSIESDVIYDYQVQGVGWQKSPIYFSNIQIFSPGF